MNFYSIDWAVQIGFVWFNAPTGFFSRNDCMTLDGFASAEVRFLLIYAAVHSPFTPSLTCSLHTFFLPYFPFYDIHDQSRLCCRFRFLLLFLSFIWLRHLWSARGAMLILICPAYFALSFCMYDLFSRC
ncbi:hypothetical protein MAP00_005079 [Monascus purpureus]|nr:hypothetical protein MAP00_005079 [Monascus purpureus]